MSEFAESGLIEWIHLNIISSSWLLLEDETQSRMAAKPEYVNNYGGSENSSVFLETPSIQLVLPPTASKACLRTQPMMGVCSRQPIFWTFSSTFSTFSFISHSMVSA